MHHKEGGVASTSACQRQDVEHQAHDLNQRQHPRDMPAVILVKDTGESKTLWSPSEATDSGPHNQDVADLEGKVSETMQSMGLTTANCSSKDVSHKCLTDESRIQSLDRPAKRKRADLGEGFDFAWLPTGI